MKKSLILTLLLLMLSITSISASHNILNSTKDKVIINETVLLGDKSKAKGITVKNRTHYDYHLFWDTEYTIGDELNVKTEFNFSKSKKTEDYERENEIYIYPNLNFSTSGTREIDFENRQGFPIKLITDVASRVKAGEIKEEIVLLRDYYEFYSLTMDGNFYDMHIDTMYDGSETDYGNYFKIPVPPDHTVKISIAKNEAGEITRIECNSLDNEVIIQTSGIVTDEGCYITITINKNNSDSSQIQISENIPGIHFFPLKDKKSTAVLRYFDIENAKRVYPIDNENCHILNLKNSVDNTQLLMFTREFDEIFLSVIDIKTMELIQKTVLHKSENPSLINIKQYDDFLVTIFENGFFCLLTYDQKEYKVELSDSFSRASEAITNIEEIISYYDIDIDFDGDRMAVCAHTNYYRSCSSYLLVYNSTGLAYAGEYSHSLNDPNNVNWLVRPIDSNSLNVICN